MSDNKEHKGMSIGATVAFMAHALIIAELTYPYAFTTKGVVFALADFFTVVAIYLLARTGG